VEFPSLPPESSPT